MIRIVKLEDAQKIAEIVQENKMNDAKNRNFLR